MLLVVALSQAKCGPKKGSGKGLRPMTDIQRLKLNAPLTLIYRLFDILVDSDKTAAHILSIMNKHKYPGEVSFMPLNRLQSKAQQYPTTSVSTMLVKPQFTNSYYSVKNHRVQRKSVLQLAIQASCS